MLEQTITQQADKPTAQYPRQGEWTYDHWLNLPDDGWKYEIIDGVLYMSPPPAIDHQRSSGKLFVAMATHIEAHDLGEVLEAPCGVRLPNQPVPVEPDILFIRKDRLGIIGQNYVEGPPDLIVEILSPSNPHHDREIKFRLYCESGVSEYWLVNYLSKIVEVYQLIDGKYNLLGKYNPGDVVTSRVIDNFKIDPAKIFPA